MEVKKIFGYRLKNNLIFHKTKEKYVCVEHEFVKIGHYMSSYKINSHNLNIMANSVNCLFNKLLSTAIAG